MEGVFSPFVLITEYTSSCCAAALFPCFDPRFDFLARARCKFKLQELQRLRASDGIHCPKASIIKLYNTNSS